MDITSRNARLIDPEAGEARQGDPHVAQGRIVDAPVTGAVEVAAAGAWPPGSWTWGLRSGTGRASQGKLPVGRTGRGAAG